MKVNVYNDAEMVSLGIRPPMLKPKDVSMWRKTPEERKLWKSVRRVKVPNSRWSSPTKANQIPGRLIVHAKGEKKSTFSHSCVFSDISYILSKYKKVIKATWNGRELGESSVLGWKLQTN